MSRRRTHIVKRKEKIEGIAKLYGYSSYKELWDHSANQALKKKRKEKECIEPGDVFYLPLPKEFEKRIDAHLSDMSFYQNSVSRQRAEIPAVVSELENRIKQLDDATKQMDVIVTDYTQKVEAAAAKAKDAREVADWLQIVGGLVKGLAKMVARTAVTDSSKFARRFDSGARKAAEKKARKSGEDVKSIGESDVVTDALTRELVTSHLKLFGDITVEITPKMMAGDGRVKRTLEFLDDATSIGQYLWVLTRGMMGGGWSWDSIEKDAKKKTAELKAEAEGYKSEIAKAIRDFRETIDGLKTLDITLTTQINEVEIRATKIVACMK